MLRESLKAHAHAMVDVGENLSAKLWDNKQPDFHADTICYGYIFEAQGLVLNDKCKFW